MAAAVFCHKRESDELKGPILILADDLTGAADCAVQFRQVGFPTVVLTRLTGCQAAFARFRVVSLSLHTRDASAASVRRIWQRHGPAIAKLAAGALVYQKIDSTLRGHAALEVRLLLRHFGPAAAVIAPAFPKQGRQTIDGVHRVHGAPLAETEYARTSTNSPVSSYLPELFTWAGDAVPAHLPTHIIERGTEVVREWLREHLAGSCRLMTADAAHERHLDTLTQAVLPLGSRLLLVGSAGWAERLALACKARLTPAQPSPGVLSVVGSLSAVATRQVQATLNAGAMVVPFNSAITDSPSRATMDNWSALIEAVAAGRHAVVWTNPGDASSAPRQTGRRALRGLGEIVRAILSTTAVSGLAMVGGDTAHMVLRALRASGLTLAGEIAAGIPYGRLLDGPFAGLPTVTKAGGFGTDTVLQDCLEFLRGWAAQ
jgi:D-threonate/D-erythronate kinase